MDTQAKVLAMVFGDNGQTMAEYALILAGVFIIASAALMLLGDPVQGLLQGAIHAFP